MSDISSMKNKLMVNGLMLGLAYCLGGVLQISSTFGLTSIPLVPSDVLSGSILILLSSVFLNGIFELRKNNMNEGYAFIMVGAILVFILFILQIIILTSHALGWVLNFEDWVEWTLFQDLGPAIWLFPLASPMFYLHRKAKKSINN